MTHWLKKQYETAKIAWLLVTIIFSLFGYNISVTSNNKNIEQNLIQISQNIQDIHQIINTINSQNIEHDIQRPN
jgi:hypothetical protein